MISKKVGIPLCILGGIVLAFVVMFTADSLGHGVDCETGTYHNVEHSHFVDCIHENGKFDAGCESKAHLHPDAIQHSGPDCDEEVKDWFADKHRNSDAVAGQTLDEHRGGSPTPTTSTPTPLTMPEPVRVSTPTRGSTVSRSSSVSEQVIEQIVEDANNQADKPVPKLESSYYRCETGKAFYAVEFQSGLDFHAPKVMPAGVSTIAGLWERYHWVSESGGAFYILHAGIWFAYRGEYENVGNLPIHPHTALVIEFNGETFRELIRGCVVADWDSLRLNQGMNLIGLPNQREDYALPSDFLEDGVSVVIVERNGQFYSIAQIGDAGDEALQAGDAVLLFNSLVSAAPSVRRRGTLAVSWGAMKR